VRKMSDDKDKVGKSRFWNMQNIFIILGSVMFVILIVCTSNVVLLIVFGSDVRVIVCDDGGMFKGNTLSNWDKFFEDDSYPNNGFITLKNVERFNPDELRFVNSGYTQASFDRNNCVDVQG